MLNLNDDQSIAYLYQEIMKQVKQMITNAMTGIKSYISGIVLDMTHPVNSIYMSADPTSPGELFGGTWVQIKDCFLLAAGDTYAAGSTGGEAAHTVSYDEMPPHYHNVLINFQAGASADMYSVTPVTSYNPSINGAWMGTTTSAGGGQPHNNMPPYLTVYIWKRTK